MDVCHARHDGAAALVDNDRARGGGEPIVDAADSAILDDDGRRSALALGSIDDQPPGLDRIRLGVRRSRGKQRGCAGKQMFEHENPSGRDGEA